MNAKPTKFSVIEGAVRYYTTGKIGLGEKILVSVLLLAYVLSPLDMIPDFMPVVGWLDDIGVSSLALWFFNHRVAGVESSKSEEALDKKVDVIDAELVGQPSAAQQQQQLFYSETGKKK